MASIKGRNPGDLPIGQRWIQKWPERTAERPPDVHPGSWTVKVTGLVEKPLALTLQEVQALGAVEIVRDFHCVESWSVPHNKWKGVPLQRVLELARPLPEALYALIGSPGGYETDLSLEILLLPDTLLVWEHGGEPLTWEHGYPLRLIVPDLYAYKSAKWVSQIKIVSEDSPGFWEKRGYHRGANVWSGERLGGDSPEMRNKHEK